MLISDLEHLEIVQGENQVQGGLQALAIATMAGSGYSDTGIVSVSGGTSANTYDETSYYGDRRVGANSYSFVSASANP
jgi:hypothetical protein